jgi:Ca2+/H+ antiporter
VKCLGVPRQTGADYSRFQIRLTRQADAPQDANFDVFVHSLSPAVLFTLFSLVFYFQLRTHAHIFVSEEEPGSNEIQDLDKDAILKLTPGWATLIFSITTLLVAICGDYIITALGENEFTQTLAGTAILPILMGGAEISGSIMCAVRGQPSLVRESTSPFLFLKAEGNLR